jgi:hypothetical protein
MGETGDVLRHPVQRRHHRAQRIRHENVVGIEKENVGRARGCKPGISRGADTGIFLADNRQTAVGNGSQDFRRGVGRSVIDHDQFDIFEALAKDAGQCLLNEPFSVVGGDDDGYAGSCRGGGVCVPPRRARSAAGVRRTLLQRIARRIEIGCDQGIAHGVPWRRTRFKLSAMLASAHPERLAEPTAHSSRSRETPYWLGSSATSWL